MANTFDPANESYKISTLEDFVAFRDYVNAGNNCAGKNVTLEADIDLSTIENWEPIGNSSAPFNGNFDGQGHTISNLKCDRGNSSDAGLFGRTNSGTIENFTLENAQVSGRLNVGAVAGTPYTTKYSNITLTGLVQVEGMAYVGGMFGKNAYADLTDLTIDAADGSYVKADSVEGGVAYRTYVGGVVGFIGEGGHTLKNIYSNIDVEGSTCDAGGIAGIAHYGNNFENVVCDADSVTLTNGSATSAETMEIGGIAGTWHNGGSAVSMTDCSVSGDLKLEVQVDGVTNDELTAAVQNNILTGSAYSASGSGSLTVGSSSEYIIGEVIVANGATYTADVAKLAAAIEITDLAAGEARTIQVVVNEALHFDVAVEAGATNAYLYSTEFVDGTYSVIVIDNGVPSTRPDAEVVNGKFIVKDGTLDVADLQIGEYSSVTVSGNSSIQIEKHTGKAIEFTGGTLTDSYLGSAFDNQSSWLHVSGEGSLAGTYTGQWIWISGDDAKLTIAQDADVKVTSTAGWFGLVVGGMTNDLNAAIYDRPEYTLGGALVVEEGASVDAAYIMVGGNGEMTIAGDIADLAQLEVNAGGIDGAAAGKITVTGSLTNIVYSTIAGTLDIAGGFVSSADVDGYAGGFTVAGTVNLTDGGILDVTDSNVTINGTLQIEDKSKLIGKSLTLGADGKLIVDAAGFSGTAKLIDIDAASLEGIVTIANRADNVQVYYCADGDVILSDATTDTIYVNAAWNDKEFGYDLGGGMAYGINAFDTYAEALGKVADGGTISLIDGMTGSELGSEIGFEKDIKFTLTGKAPEFELPVVTFQNAEMTIQDAEISTPELDARQNAVINVDNATVYDAGGNSIIKSYYNGAINLSDSTAYTMQVTTMGYITVDNSALTATWQTNVLGNGLITLTNGATFNTAALQLTGDDYSGRDNTDADRVGQPAAIVVDNSNLIVGKAYSAGGADYSYHSSFGFNIGTIAGKAAILDVKNNSVVGFYGADGQTVNIGADGVVNIADSVFTVDCRDAAGTVTLVNNGVITIDADSLLTADALTNAGTITINASGFTGESIKVIDLNQGSKLTGTVKLTNGSGYYLQYAADGDVSITKSPEVIYVSSDYNADTDGWGHDRFNNYSSALSFASANAKKATIVMEKTTTISGNCIDQNTHKNLSNLKVVIEDGATMGNANSKWDMTYAVTIEAGGVMQSARPTNSGYGNTHVKNVWTIGEAGAEKQAEINFINSSADPYVPYKTISIAVLYNGKLVANNAVINVGDFGFTGTASFTDSTVTVAGIVAFGKNTFYKQTMTNTTMTVKGHNLMNENKYYSTEGTILDRLTMTDSSIVVDDGVDGTVAENVTIKQLTMTESEITVERGAAVNISGKFVMEGDSDLRVGSLTLASAGSITMDYISTIEFDAIVNDGGTITVDTTGYTSGNYDVLDYTGTGTMTEADYQALLGANWSDQFKVIQNDLYLTGQDNTNIFVSTAWAGLENGETTAEGYLVGYNAFGAFAEALDAVVDGGTITMLNDTVATAGEIDFEKAIKFTLTGNAPAFELPVVTFQNAEMTIQDAEISTPELDARQNAVINVDNATVYDAGGNSIIKSYYNGAINLSDSTAYTMQVTTMGYITVDNSALTATWQTNVLGNGLITLTNGATFNTAALQLTGQDYSGRDNTDADRVGQPAAIVVDDSTLIVGKAYSAGGADYSYHSSYGFNIGTIAGKAAILDVRNGGAVNFYGADGETVNIGADGIVNISDASFTVDCRTDGGLVAVINNGTINVSGNSAIDAVIGGDGQLVFDGVGLGKSTMIANNNGDGNALTLKGENAIHDSQITLGINDDITLEDGAELAVYGADLLEFGGELNIGENAYLSVTGNSYVGKVEGAESGAINLYGGTVAVGIGSTLNVGDAILRGDVVVEGAGALLNAGKVTVSDGAELHVGSKGTLTAESVKLTSVLELTGLEAGEARTLTVYLSQNDVPVGMTFTVDVAAGATSATVTVTQFDNGDYVATVLESDGTVSSQDVTIGIGMLTVDYGTLTVGTLEGSFSAVASQVNIKEFVGSAQMDYASTLTVEQMIVSDGSINITVDAAKLTSPLYKLIEITGTAALDTGKITINGAAFDASATYGEHAMVVLGNDLYLTSATADVLYANADWAGESVGTLVDGDKVVGYNAFGDVKSAFAVGDGKVISVADNVTANWTNNKDAAAGQIKLSAGTYTVTGGGDSYGKLNSIFMQEANSEVALIIDDAQFTIGKLIAGSNDTRNTNTSSITVKNSLLKAAKYSGDAAWWTMWGDTTTVIEDSVIGLNSTSALDITQFTKGAAGADLAYVPYGQNHSAMNFGSAGTVTITDSTMLTGFFQVADRGITTLDNALIYLGGSLSVGYKGAGTATWSGVSADTYNVDGVATLTIGNGSIVQNIGWGDGNGNQPANNIGMHVGGSKAGAVIVTEGSLLAMEINDKNNNPDSISIYDNGSLLVEDGSTVISREFSNAGTVFVNDAALSVDTLVNNGMLSLNNGELTAASITGSGTFQLVGGTYSVTDITTGRLAVGDTYGGAGQAGSAEGAVLNVSGTLDVTVKSDTCVWIGYDNDTDWNAANQGKFVLNLQGGTMNAYATHIANAGAVNLTGDALLDGGYVKVRGSLTVDGSRLRATTMNVYGEELYVDGDTSKEQLVSMNTVSFNHASLTVSTQLIIGKELKNGQDVLRHGTVRLTNSTAIVKKLTINQESLMDLISSDVVVQGDVALKGELKLDYTSSLIIDGTLNFSTWSYPCNYGTPQLTIDTTGYSDGKTYKVVDTNGITGPRFISGSNILMFNDDYYVTEQTQDALYVNDAWKDLAIGTVVDDKIVGYNAFGLDLFISTFNTADTANDIAGTVYFQGDAVSAITDRNLCKFYTDVDVTWAAESAAVIDATSSSRLYLMDTVVATGDSVADADFSDIAEITIGENITLKAKILNLGQAIDSDDVDASGNATRDGGSITLTVESGAVMNVTAFYLNTGSTLNIEKGAKVEMIKADQETVVRAGGVINVTGSGNDDLQWSGNWISMQGGILNLTDTAMTIGALKLNADTRNQLQTSTGSTINAKNVTLSAGGVELNAGAINLEDAAFTASSVESSGVITVAGASTLNIGTLTGIVELLDGVELTASINGGTVNAAAGVSAAIDASSMGTLINRGSVVFTGANSLATYEGWGEAAFAVVDGASLTVAGSLWQNTSTWKQDIANYDIAGTLTVGGVANLSSSGTISGTATSTGSMNFYGTASITGTVTAAGSSVGWPTTDSMYEAGENKTDGIFLSGNGSYTASGRVTVYEEASISLKDNASFAAGSVVFADAVTAGAACGSLTVAGNNLIQIGALSGSGSVLFDDATVKAGSSISGGTDNVRFLGTNVVEAGAVLDLTNSKVWVGSLLDSDSNPVIESGMEATSLTLNGDLNTNALWVGARYDDDIVDGITAALTVDGSAVQVIGASGKTAGLVVRASGIVSIENGGSITMSKEAQTVIQGAMTISGAGTVFESLAGPFTVYKSTGVVTVEDGAKLILKGTNNSFRVGLEGRGGKMILDNGALEFTNALQIWGEFEMDWESTITFSKSITVENGGSFTLDLEGYVGDKSNRLLIDSVNGDWTVDQYKALVGDVWNDKAFAVIDGDLYLNGYFADKVYVNSEYTATDCDGYSFGVNAFASIEEAKASGANDIEVTGGALTSTVTFEGTPAVISDVTANAVIFGGSRIDVPAKEWSDTEGTISLTIENGIFNRNVIGGSGINSGSSEHIGDIELTIQGGTFARQVAGGMYHNSTNYRDITLLNGDVNMTIEGGVFNARVYGGNFGKNDDASAGLIEGNVNLVIDSSQDSIVFAENVVAGSRGANDISGDVNVTISGLGSNLDFTGTLAGGCSGDYYKLVGDGREAVSSVLGNRALVFADFEGNFDARIAMFESLAITEATAVNFTNDDCMFDEIGVWTFEAGSSVTGVVQNDFAGDTIEFDLTDFDGSAWTAFSGDITGLADATIKLDGVTAAWDDVNGFWSTGDFKLVVEDDKKLVISALA